MRLEVETADARGPVPWLAGRLRIAPDTISRALGEPNRRGLTESRAGAGTVVIADSTPQQARQAALRAELRDLPLRQSGLSVPELRTLLRESVQAPESTG